MKKTLTEGLPQLGLTLPETRIDFLCAFAMPGNTFINNEYWRVPGKSRRTA